jgi:Domain of unknown function (DUF1843)
MASAHVLYGVVIKDAIASKDLKKMKAVASEAQKQIKELETGLKGLQSALDKLAKK